MSTLETHTPLGHRSPRSPIRAVSGRGLVVGVLALIPVLAATGLSLPLPSAVERIAAALVPWAEATTLSDQPLAIGAAGSIALTSTDRRTGGEAAPPAAPRAQPLNRRKPKDARQAAPKPAATRPDPAAATNRGARPERSGVEPSPVPILTAADPIRSTTSNSPIPDAGTPVKPIPDPGPQLLPDPGPKPSPIPVPVPTPAPPNVAPVQQVVDVTLGTVANTTQTIVDSTVPGLSETVHPVTAIVADPVGAVGGIVSNPVGALGGLLAGPGRRK